MDEREQTLANLNTVRDTFFDCKPMMDELDTIAAFKASSRTPTIVGYWIPFLACGLGALTSAYFERFDTQLFRLFLIFGLIFLLTGIVLLSRRHSKLPELTRSYQESLNNASQREIYLNGEIQKTMSEKGIQSVFPFNYFNAEAIGYCIYVVQSFRANNIKEALNLYEVERFQRNMLSVQQQQLSVQQRQLAVQQQIQRDASGARKAAAVGAVMNGVTAFNVSRINRKL